MFAPQGGEEHLGEASLAFNHISQKILMDLVSLSWTS